MINLFSAEEATGTRALILLVLWRNRPVAHKQWNVLSWLLAVM